MMFPALFAVFLFWLASITVSKFPDVGVGLNAGLSDRLNSRVDYDYKAYDYTSTSWFGTSLGVRR